MPASTKAFLATILVGVIVGFMTNMITLIVVEKFINSKNNNNKLTQ